MGSAWRRSAIRTARSTSGTLHRATVWPAVRITRPKSIWHGYAHQRKEPTRVLRSGAWKEANAAYTEAIRLDPTDAQAYYERGNNLCVSCASTTRRSPIWRSHPTRSEPRRLVTRTRGFLYLMKGDSDKAIADCTEAIRLDPKYAWHITTVALPTGKRANTTKRSPTIPRPSGSTRNSPRRTTTGASAYNARATTTKRSPTSPRPSGSTRKLPWRTTTGALPTSTRASTTKRLPTAPRPSGSTRKLALAYNNRGLAYNDKGDYDKAIADCTEAIRLDPKFALGVQQPGICLQRQERVRQSDCRLHRGHPARPKIRQRVQQPGHLPTSARASTTKRLPT